MTGLMTCEAIWFAGLIAWYIIRRPFERTARRVATINHSSVGASVACSRLLSPACSLFPGVYALKGFPRQLDRPIVPAIAYLGLALLCGALALFYRSHLDLGRNWSISLEIS